MSTDPAVFYFTTYFSLFWLYLLSSLWRPISNDHICSSSILWRLISSGDDYSFHLCDYKAGRINVQCSYLHQFVDFFGFEEVKTLATILMTLFILCIYSFRPEYILFCTSSRMLYCHQHSIPLSDSNMSNDGKDKGNVLYVSFLCSNAGFYNDYATLLFQWGPVMAKWISKSTT